MTKVQGNSNACSRTGRPVVFKIEIPKDTVPNAAANTLLILEQDATDELIKLLEQTSGYKKMEHELTLWSK